MRVRRNIVQLIVAACLAATTQVTAVAELGGSVDTVEQDRVQMRAALMRRVQSGSATFHEIRTPAGTTVREFTSTSGKVFGVAWEGPFQPDLRQLLGRYFTQFTDTVTSARKARRGRGPMLVQAGDLVVQIGGHPRAFTGRIYVVSLVPQGFDPAAIQ